MYLSGRAAARDHAHARRRVSQGGGAGVPDLVFGRRRSQELRQPRRLRHRAGHHVHRPVEDGRLRPAAAVLARPASSRCERVGARTIDDFILDCRGQREAAGGDPVQAGFLNTPIIIAETQADPRYRAAQNRAVPKKIDSHLVTFDCITCDKCIPVCPNDANFLLSHGRVATSLIATSKSRPTAASTPIGDEREFVAREGRPDRQLRRLLQPLRQLRHVLPRIRRPVFEEAELLRQPAGVRSRRSARRIRARTSPQRA